jgi:hypothetical protein
VVVEEKSKHNPEPDFPIDNVEKWCPGRDDRMLIMNELVKLAGRQWRQFSGISRYSKTVKSDIT